MTVKAIFVECSVPVWLGAALQLSLRRGWAPVYWLAAHSFEQSVAEYFPEAIFHANLDAVRGIAPARCARIVVPPLDQQLLNQLAPFESVALRMMDRMDPDESFSYSERVRLYHRHVRYWLGVFNELQPEVILFPNAPHLVYDYVLYQLAKVRGIRTLMFNESSVDGLVYPVPEFENGSRALTAVYQQLLSGVDLGGVALSARAERYLQKTRSDYAAGQPAYLKELYGTAPQPVAADPVRPGWLPPQVQLRLRPLLKVWRYPNYCRRALRKLALYVEPHLRFLRGWGQSLKLARRYRSEMIVLMSRDGPMNTRVLDDAIYCTFELYKSLQASHAPSIKFSDPAPLTYLKERGEPPERASYTGLEYWLYRLMAEKKKTRLREHYDRLASQPDFGRPYVYVALHYQPEKSTSPEGGVFADQFLVVDLLSKCLPDGWKVLVKEHPFQLDARGSGEMTRTTQLYDDLTSLPNVQLVPRSACPFDLIDHARAVATVSGTSGWEAVVRGKPVLTFGHAWYNGCEGVFHTPTREACTSALDQIARGYTLDLRKIKVFVQALEQIGFQGYTIPDLADMAEVSEEGNVHGFVSAIEKLLETRRAA